MSASAHNFYTPDFLLQCLCVIQSGYSVLFVCLQLTNDIWIIGCAMYSNSRGLDIFRLQNLSLNVESLFELETRGLLTTLAY